MCQHCGMGVLELFPKDISELYDDKYYDNASNDTSTGYANYDLSSTHGVLWAAELLKLTKRSGRVLDIGCANGFLLRHLGTSYEKYGIEANAKAAKAAKSEGVNVISNDILDSSLLLNYTGFFDVITSIAVFEHISDFKGSIEASLQMLKPDGILIFEVPLVSEINNNDTWFNSSLEHLYYPTTRGMQYLFETVLKTELIGGEIVIRDYASTYIGIATRDQAIGVSVKALYERLTCSLPTDLSIEERRVQLLLKVIHAADPDPALISFLFELFPDINQIPLITRCLDLWKADSLRLQGTRKYLNEVEMAKEWHSQNSERWKRAYEECEITKLNYDKY